MLRDILGAFAFLTVLPIGYYTGEQPGRTFAHYPLVGLVIGALLLLVAELSPLSTDISALLVLLTWVMITGGLHLDGFADSCDGLLATVEPARRLDIMKDPRTGSWAVIGLILLLLGKWVTLREVTPLLLMVPPVLGRCGMTLAAVQFPYARASNPTSSLGAYFRQGLGMRQALVAAGVTVMVVLGYLAIGQVRVLYAYGVMWLLLLTVPVWAARRLGGGLTGDVYGALCELTEVTCLLVLSV